MQLLDFVAAENKCTEKYYYCTVIYHSVSVVVLYIQHSLMFIYIAAVSYIGLLPSGMRRFCTCHSDLLISICGFFFTSVFQPSADCSPCVIESINCTLYNYVHLDPAHGNSVIIS